MKNVFEYRNLTGGYKTYSMTTGQHLLAVPENDQTTDDLGGKTVTVLYGVPGSDEDRRQLFKQIKQICGRGGACKQGRIEIQGDHRDKIMTILADKHITAKAAGG